MTTSTPKPGVGAGGGGTRPGVSVRADQPERQGATQMANPAVAAARLGMVLQLSRRARLASGDELPFIIANETRQLVAYRQSALWRVDRGKPRLAALSGLAVIDKSAPYVAWVNRFARWRLAKKGGPPGGGDGCARFSLAELEEEPGIPAWLKEWREWVPRHVLETVMLGPGGWVCGYLCLFGDAGFSDSDERLLGHLADAYGDRLGGLAMRPRRRMLRFGFWRVAGLLLAILVAAAMFVPRPQTVLARAEVTPRRPALVRAGIDGVVETFLVEPNQRVREGDPLLRLEDTQLRTRLAVARKAEEMARVELRQLQQAALGDARSKARLPIAKGRLDQLAAEAEYVSTLLDRVVSTSPLDGVALVDNPDDWRGRPVSLGQKIMMVANPGEVMLEAYLPIAEALKLDPGGELLFFPNVAPASPVRARIEHVGYRAVDVPGAGMSYLVRAAFVDPGPPMLGLRGTARLQGDPMPLGLIVLRRPIMAVRQWLGW